MAATFVCAALLITPLATADTFQVTSSATGSGPGTLRWAVEQANLTPGPHTINVAALEITLDADLPALATEVEVRGAGRSETIIQASATEDDPLVNRRIFRIGATGDVLLADMTVRHGALRGGVLPGAGIYNEGTLTLENVHLSGNHMVGASLGQFGGSGRGGGIATDGPLAIVNCTISGNVARGGSGADDGGSAWGGGIYVTSTGSATIETTTISENEVRGGQGFARTGGSGLGGGIYLADGGTAIITRSTISDNLGVGGLANMSFPPGVAAGAGLYLIGNNPNSAELRLSTVSGNSTQGQGGSSAGIVSGAGLTVDSCTITDNRCASPSGNGGWSVFASAPPSGPYVRNTILCGNFASGGGIPMDLSGRVESRGFLLVGTLLVGSGAGVLDTTTGDNTAEGNQLSVNDPLLGSLEDNGGPTFTHALLPSSPALDLGTDTFVSGASTSIDQRGFPRISDGAGRGGRALQADIGAFELQGNPSFVTQFNLYK